MMNEIKSLIYGNDTYAAVVKCRKEYRSKKWYQKGSKR